MEAVIAVAEELSFSRAGGRLHLSQPAITKQIAAHHLARKVVAARRLVVAAKRQTKKDAHVTVVGIRASSI
jgi:hypothetical protein